MTQNTRITSVSMSHNLWRACRTFCDDYSMAFSKLVRSALFNYLDDIKKDTKESKRIALIAKLEQLEEKSKMIRRFRDSMIRDGSGIKEIKGLRVSGKVEKEFEPSHVGYSWTKGRIKDPEEREIYGELCDIVEEYNKERKKVLQNLLELLRVQEQET